MIIPTLGRGQLYRVHKEKRHMLNKHERGRVIAYIIMITLLLGYVASVVHRYWPIWKP